MELLVETKDKIKKEYTNIIENSVLESRKYEENKCIREPFQRDRDRIIHSRAFRRLSGKTQVFNSNKGDHYRTRLTHSLEVSQISRTIGKSFGLNEELIEAIALGHDLGHTPFGHVIERTIHDILKNNEITDLEIFIPGGFKHNFQSLHIVDNIEMGHRDKRGLNLTLATRDGILKHTGNKIYSSKSGKKENVEYENLDLGLHGINLMDYEQSITLEGQIVALADEIAQSTHDLEDGVRSGIIKLDILRRDFSKKIKEIKFNIKKDGFSEEQFNELYECIFDWISNEPNSNDLTLDTNKLINKLINLFVLDAIKFSMYNIINSNTILDSNNVVPELLIENSKYVKEIRSFLSNYIYKHVVSSQEVAQSDSKAKYLIKQIFKAYYEDPRQLPNYALNRYYSKKGNSLDRTLIVDSKVQLQKEAEFIRIICDHIAGMTDSFAMEEYNNLYGVSYTL